MTRLLAAALLVLLPLTAHAAWTPEERVEMYKLVEAGVITENVLASLAFEIEHGRVANPNGAEVVDLYQYAHSASESLMFAVSCGIMVNTTRTSGECIVSTPRDLALTKMYSRIDTYLRQVPNIQAALIRLGLPTLAAQLGAQRLGTFNRALAYTNAAPASFPNVVGPHGDYVIAQQGISVALEYTLKARAIAITNWRTRHGDIVFLARSLQAAAQVTALAFRIWGGDSGLVSADDEATALSDSACGTGLRPPSFFALLLRIEYAGGVNANSDGLLRNFCGRVMKVGIKNFLQTFITNFEFYQGSLIAQNERTTGAFYTEAVQGWTALDLWFFAVTSFFRPPPAPPGTGTPPPSECPVCPAPVVCPVPPTLDYRITITPTVGAPAEFLCGLGG